MASHRNATGQVQDYFCKDRVSVRVSIRVRVRVRVRLGLCTFPQNTARVRVPVGVGVR